MHRRTIVRLWVAVWAATWLAWGLNSSWAQEAAPRVLRAGAATSNITPPLGEPIVGGFEPFPAETVHDELHARCLVLDDGQTKVAIVVCDSLGVPREVYDLAKEMIEKSTGIPATHVMASATHTHSATSARGRPQGDEKFGEYGRFLARRIADGVARANHQLRPAKIAWSSAQAPEHVHNRRWFMNSAEHTRNPFGGFDRVRMNPPRNHADLMHPAGPTDPEVSFLAVQGVDGRPIALMANYGLHYVGGVRKGEVSADYFALFAGRMAELLGVEKQDPPFVAMISNGTSGDVNNINFREAGKWAAPYEQMTFVAHSVADKVFEAHKKLEYQDWVRLAAAQRELTLAVRKPTKEQIEFADAILAKPETADQHHSRERNYAQRAKRLAESPAELQIPLQALAIGDLGLAAIPFETFAEIGLKIKAESPMKKTIVVSIANSSHGYLPTPEQHLLGGYETWMGTNNVETQASVKITAALLDLLEGLSKGAPK